MPWTPQQFKAKHNSKLSKAESTHAASIANAMIANGAKEGVAIATANKEAQKHLDRMYGAKKKK